MTAQAVLAVAVSVYGVLGAFASLLQLCRLRRLGSARDVSLLYLSAVGGGYLLWLAYGVVLGNIPLVLADAAGGLTVSATICVALQLRRGRRCLRRPVRPGLRSGEATQPSRTRQPHPVRATTTLQPPMQ